MATTINKIVTTKPLYPNEITLNAERKLYVSPNPEIPLWLPDPDNHQTLQPQFPQSRFLNNAKQYQMLLDKISTTNESDPAGDIQVRPDKVDSCVW